MRIQVRDPVHNFIELSNKEINLVNSRALQRLRGIKQLALASLVYPGALHTRFDHTLGVAHVAGCMAHTIGLTDDAEIIRQAALLHDIGHGPFSHVSEYALERYAERSKIDQAQKKDKIHELVTARMIQTDSEIRNILGVAQCNKIVDLLRAGIGQPALKSIVSGPLDADKQDYLLRDSKFCGVQYGVFDIHQLHRSLVLDGDQDEKQLMIDRDGVHTVEQYVLAKYYMTSNVYRHQVRLISDQMIVRAIVLGIEHDEISDLSKLYTYDGSETFVRNYAAWDDARFMTTFGGTRHRSTLCGKLVDRLLTRRLLKRVYAAGLRELKPLCREVLKDIGKKENDSARAFLEKEIAKEVARITSSSIDKDLVIVHAYDIKSVRTMSRNDEASIMVARPAGNPIPFEQESTLFKSINQRMSDVFVEVFAPVNWEDHTQRKKCREKLSSVIQGILESVANNQPKRKARK